MEIRVRLLTLAGHKAAANVPGEQVGMQVLGVWNVTRG